MSGRDASTSGRMVNGKDKFPMTNDSTLFPESPLVNLSQRSKFRLEYEYQLTAEVEAHPDEYGYPISRVSEVAALMVDAMSRGSANIRASRAIRRTCTKLGVKYTQTAIKAYINA